MRVVGETGEENIPESATIVERPVEERSGCLITATILVSLCLLCGLGPGVAGLALAGGLWWAYSLRQKARRPNSLSVGRDGITWETPSQKTLVPWSEVLAFGSCGRLGSTEITVKTKDGPRSFQSTSVDNARHCSTALTILRERTASQLEELRERLHAGETLDFGIVRLSQTQLVVHQGMGTYRTWVLGGWRAASDAVSREEINLFGELLWQPNELRQLLGELTPDPPPEFLLTHAGAVQSIVITVPGA